jgi:serine/threonine protein kinase
MSAVKILSEPNSLPLKISEDITLLKQLKIGGFGQIYLGEINKQKLNFKKMVAVKFPDTITDEAYFLEEISILSRLSHPNIGSVLSVGKFNETPYIVMEFIDGINLHELLQKSIDKRHKLSIELLSHIALKVLKALEYIDGLQLFHADLSLSNIMITSSGEIKLVDFGLSFKSAHCDKGVKGKLSYLSYNRLNGKNPTIHDDCYSLAVCLAELNNLALFINPPGNDELLSHDPLKISKELLNGNIQIAKHTLETKASYSDTKIVKELNFLLNDQILTQQTTHDIPILTKSNKKNPKIIYSVVAISIIVIGSYLSINYYRTPQPLDRIILFNKSNQKEYELVVDKIQYNRARLNIGDVYNASSCSLTCSYVSGFYQVLVDAYLGNDNKMKAVTALMMKDQNKKVEVIKQFCSAQPSCQEVIRANKEYNSYLASAYHGSIKEVVTNFEEYFKKDKEIKLLKYDTYPTMYSLGANFILINEPFKPQNCFNFAEDAYLNLMRTYNSQELSLILKHSILLLIPGNSKFTPEGMKNRTPVIGVSDIKNNAIVKEGFCIAEFINSKLVRLDIRSAGREI